MKTALSILTVLVAATTAFCRPVGVEIQPADLKILSDLPAMSFRITAEDRTSSANKPAPMKGLLAVEGVNAKPGLAFQIGDETIGLNVEHQVAGPTVTVNTKWETTSNPPARWMETLIVPSDIAQDLTADIDGFPAFHNYEVMPPPSPLQKTTAPSPKRRSFLTRTDPTCRCKFAYCLKHG